MANPPIVVSALKKHTATMIMLHGLGDTGHGWSFLAQYMRAYIPHVKFIFPNAPVRPISLNGGMPMPGWFDIYSLDKIIGQEDEEGLLKSRDYIQGLVDKEVEAGIPSDRIVLGGFSQGGAMTLLTGLTLKKKLAGMVVLSGYLPLHSKVFSMASKESKLVPIFQGHGTDDQVVSYKFGQQSRDELANNKYNVEFNSYSDMGHSACDDELKDLVKFLEKVIPQNNA
ncbi:hypothetical protein H4219_002402 [Mycoemilia scoparia]|uniref:Acyl-protein thioesterase 1 n=1 Tax=Mycoemilia scoparia TaxID=417184 RepID=A0A9W8DP62_9FUNG|nr:hypothetical protein H4219_002402 [Mycoemilia scoparia]